MTSFQEIPAPAYDLPGKAQRPAGMTMGRGIPDIGDGNPSARQYQASRVRVLSNMFPSLEKG